MTDHGMQSNGMDSKQNAEYPEWNWGDVSGADDDGLFKNDDTNFKADCDCPGLPSPPKFALPPPPVPFSASNCPFHNGDGYYSPANGGTNGHFDANGLSDLEYCDIQVLEGPYTQTAIPSIAVIVVVSFFTLVVILVASLLFWKHKRKMQNFLPCKTSPTNHCDLTSGNSVLYEDLTNIRPRTLPNHCTPAQTIAPVELMDVKCSNYGGAGFTPVGNTTFIYPPNHENHILKCSKSKDQFNQAYEEVSASSDGKRGTADSDVDSEVEDDGDGEDMSSMSSEGELAEDELSLVEYPKKSYRENGESRPCSDASSLRGSTGDDLCRDFESTCSDDNDPRSCHHPSEFQRSIDRVYPFDGPVATSTEQRKKRKVKARNPKGVDHVRPHLHQAQPLPAIIDAYPYPINSDMMQGHLGLNVVGSDPYDDPCLSDRPPSDVLPVTRVPRGPSWRTPEMPLPLGDYHSDDRSMVLKVPNVHPQQRLPNSGGGMVELNVPKLGHHPRNNVLYRNNGDARDNHRVPPDEYGLLPGNSTWGPETGSSQRNSDPHDRNLAEFSTFRPRKSSQSRDLFGLDAGLLNNDLGGHYGHLPPSQRSSGSDGSKGSSNSAERLLPPNSEPGVGIGGGGGGPYQQHYHPHSHQLPQQPQSHFLGSSPSSTGGGHRVAFPSNQRVKRKQGDKNTAELDAGYGARTVFT